MWGRPEATLGEPLLGLGGGGPRWVLPRLARRHWGGEDRMVVVSAVREFTQVGWRLLLPGLKPSGRQEGGSAQFPLGEMGRAGGPQEEVEGPLKTCRSSEQEAEE